MAEALRLFEVTVGEYPPRLVQAKSASAARYDRFLSISDVYEISFRDFAKMTKVRAVKPAPLPPRHPAMTAKMRELARHALGLPNDQLRSYRNRFVTARPCADGVAWEAMVEVGLAKSRAGHALPFGGDNLYWLTREGAQSALDVGETLCPEDFPAHNHGAVGSPSLQKED